MENEFSDFRRASCLIGSDISLTQGAGGNTSIKLAPDVMRVKASGKWLSQALEDDIFVDVDWSVINRNIAAGSADVLSGAIAENCNGLRPSIETTLHSLMPHRVVYHTHSVRAISHAIWRNSHSLLRERLKGIDWAYIPYTKPGEPLTGLVHRALRLRKKDVLVIQNHGLVVGGDTVEECLATMRLVEDRLRCEIRRLDRPATSAARPGNAGADGYQLLQDEHALNLACCPAAIKIATGGSLYPDHVVFLGSSLSFATDLISARSALEHASHSNNPLAPKTAIVEGKGVLCSDILSTGGKEMVKAVAQVSLLDPGGDTVRYLTREEELELVNWDAEKFRQSQ